MSNQNDGHSYNRTILSSLGFADPDKQNPLHDLACYYIIQDEIANTLAKKLLVDVVPQTRDCSSSDSFNHIYSKMLNCKCNYNVEQRWIAQLNEIYVGKKNIEVHVSKGHGQYKTTVGFIDVALKCYEDRSTTHEVFCGRCKMPVERDALDAVGSNPKLERPWPTPEVPETSTIAIEVKATPISPSIIIRQINLYKEYFAANKWVVATLYPIGEIDAEILDGQGIIPVRLGDRFRDWASLKQQHSS